MIKVMLISHILLSVSVNGAGDSFNMVAKNDGLELERGRLYTKWTKEAETSDHQIKEDNHGCFPTVWDFQSNSFSWFLLMVKMDQNIWIILILSSEETFKFDFQPRTFSWNHGIFPVGSPTWNPRRWYRPYKLWVF